MILLIKFTLFAWTNGQQAWWHWKLLSWKSNLYIGPLDCVGIDEHDHDEDDDGGDDEDGDEDDLTAQERCLAPRFARRLASHWTWLATLQLVSSSSLVSASASSSSLYSLPSSPSYSRPSYLSSDTLIVTELVFCSEWVTSVSRAAKVLAVKNPLGRLALRSTSHRRRYPCREQVSFQTINWAQLTATVTCTVVTSVTRYLQHLQPTFY